MDDSSRKLILASASPRRRELLARVGICFDVIAPDVDETRLKEEAPLVYVHRVARAKASSIASRHRERPILAADTIVVLGGKTLGKPADRSDAEAMLRALLGRRHHVTTAFACGRRESLTCQLVTTEVSMREGSEAEVQGYLDSEEWRGKAGGYAIQGIAAAFVTSISGSVTNVVGLPLAEVLAALAGVGIVPSFADGVPA